MDIKIENCKFYNNANIIFDEYQNEKVYNIFGSDYFDHAHAPLINVMVWEKEDDESSSVIQKLVI